MPALLLTDAVDTSFKLNRTDDVSYYLVFGQTTPKSLAAAVAEGLPNTGATIGGLLVRDCVCKQVLTQSAPFSEVWAVYSSNYTTGSLGYRRSSSLESRYEALHVPNWRSDAVTGAGTIYTELPAHDRIVLQRQIVTRTRYKQTSGLDEDTVAAFDAANAGGLRTIGGVLYIYVGSTLFTGADNQQRVVIRYHTKNAVKAIPAGTFPGQAISVPALVVLGEYAVQLPSPGDAPSITAATPAQLYSNAATVPWDT